MTRRGSQDLDPLEETQENPALPPARPRPARTRTFLALALVVAVLATLVAWLV